jgi:hypothetical protein
VTDSPHEEPGVGGAESGSHRDEPQPHDGDNVEQVASYDPPPTQPDEPASVADPRVRDAVRRLDELSDLPPAEHVEIYESVHSSLQESLAEASRQADESPADGNRPS